MIRWLFRWVARLLLLAVVLVLILASPVLYTEIACQRPAIAEQRAPLIADPTWQRAESRTLMTYPEWHIVHAYDDYAKVITDGDPHDFGYIKAVTGFWSTLCPLMEKSADMGGVTFNSKATIYTIGVSFSAELLAKATYEETLGRVATWFRGAERAQLDDLSAKQAAAYAQFLQQTPWYEWDFLSARAALSGAATEAPRDRERNLALGLEYTAKAAYADVIASAAASLGADALRMRSVISGLSADDLVTEPGISVVQVLDNAILIETDRYRAFTRIVERLAEKGADFVEIAGNDEILFTTTSDRPDPEALYSFARQGYGDFRNLIVVPVTTLANQVRNLGNMRLEHVHDY